VRIPNIILYLEVWRESRVKGREGMKERRMEESEGE
jgi:hypothetical protein